MPREMLLNLCKDLNKLGVRAVNWSVWGKERISVFDNRNFFKTLYIEKFIDDLFEKEYVEGYEEKNIENLNFYSFAVDDEGKIIKDKIIKIYRHKATESLYEVILEDGRMICVTGSHSLDILRNNKREQIPIKNCIVGDKVICADFPLLEKNNRTFELNWRPIKLGKTNINIPDTIFECPELYRFLGYFTAEGSYRKNKSGEVITFTFGKHDRDLVYINDLIDISMKLFNYKITGSLFKERSSSFQLLICSRKICQFMNDIGALGKANVKGIPYIVWETSYSNKIEYLKGLYGGDGNYRSTINKKTKRGRTTFHKRNNLHLVTASRGLASDTFNLLRLMGLLPTISIKHTKERVIEGRTLKPANYYSINVYNQESLRKVEKIICFMGGERSEVNEILSNGDTRRYEQFGENSLAIKIKKIRIAGELGLPVVYDLTVANTHKFLSGCGAISCLNTGGGSPTLNPHLKEAIEYLGTESQIKLGIFTHGAALHKFDLFETFAKYQTWVRFSIDCGTEETYIKIRKPPKGQGWENMIENLIKLTETRRKINNVNSGEPLVVGTGFVITEYNYHEILDFANYFKNFDVDYCQYKPMITVIERGGEQNRVDFWDKTIIPLLEEAKNILGNKFQLNEYKIDDLVNDPINFGRDYKQCLGSQIQPCVEASGYVTICPNHRGHHQYSYGNIYEKSFIEIWNDIQARIKVRNIIDNVERFSKCTQLCKPNQSNKTVYEISQHYHSLATDEEKQQYEQQLLQIEMPKQRAETEHWEFI